MFGLHPQFFWKYMDQDEGRERERKKEME